MKTEQVETWEQKNERERAETSARRAALCEKIEKAFALLGLEEFSSAEERADRNDTRKASIAGTSRMAYLSATCDRYGYKGRILIDLWYADSMTARDVWGGDAKHEEISVAETKTAEQIAADIERRILPRLAECIAKADAVLKSRQDYKDRLAENVRALGGVVKKNYKGDIDRTLWINGGTAEVFGDGVSFSIHSVPVDIAKKIITLLGKVA